MTVLPMTLCSDLVQKHEKYCREDSLVEVIKPNGERAYLQTTTIDGLSACCMHAHM